MSWISYEEWKSLMPEIAFKVCSEKELRASYEHEAKEGRLNKDEELHGYKKYEALTHSGNDLFFIRSVCDGENCSEHEAEHVRHANAAEQMFIALKAIADDAMHHHADRDDDMALVPVEYIRMARAAVRLAERGDETVAAVTPAQRDGETVIPTILAALLAVLPYAENEMASLRECQRRDGDMEQEVAECEERIGKAWKAVEMAEGRAA